ncbi:Signal transduction histidine-protein kinase BarA [Posidoniimonas corsicana]|uniref:Sensory/regulatory protein RpfC n=1 Tax=Posidoniimonas corsicana TaxID=1938618 RepID=A0A5C5VFX5_9BACT|nr:response regulator [Posidoniimonas corsicana]TWT37001.1 Signal transduction histidine-protein kinase BarA [Posidoniimonas corsicana]
MEPGEQQPLAEAPAAAASRGEGSLRIELRRSHLTVASFGLLSLVAMLWLAMWLNAVVWTLATETGPTLRESMRARAAVQRSLAALRGWIVLGDPELKGIRRRAWTDDIEPSLAELRKSSSEWPRPGLGDKLDELQRVLVRLRDAQWWIEELAQTPGNNPARSTLTREVEPIARVVFQAVTDCINLEKGLPEAGRKEMLAAMADIRGFFSLSRSLLAARIEGDASAESAAFYDATGLVNHRIRYLHGVADQLTSTQQGLLGVIASEVRAYESLAAQALAATSAEDSNLAQSRLADDAIPLANRASDLLEEITAQMSAKVDDQTRLLSNYASAAVVTATTLLMCMGLVALVVSDRRARRLARPIVDLSLATEQLAGGELSDDLPVQTDDEIGRLTGAFNQMRRTLVARDEALAAADRDQRILESRLRATVESSPIAMVMINDQGLIVLVNAEAERMFGYSRDSLKGEPVELLMPGRFHASHRRQVQGFFNRPRSQQMGDGRELRGVRSDGREFPIEVGLNPVITDEGILVLSAILDITDRRKAEDALVKSREQALQASRAKSEFLANMSHEIRTPMNAVIGLTELVLGSNLDATQRDHLDTVLSSADALLDIINDILDFSKIEAGKLELEAIDFDVRNLVGDTLKTLSLRAHERGVEVAFRVDPAVPQTLVGDPTRLRQVLVNLVGNSLKFTDSGHIRIDVAPTGPVGPDDGSVELLFAVEDTGIGIAEEKLSSIFDAFEQADSSSSRRHGGTGLGLAISTRIVRQMGGEIWAESVLGAGSTFRFRAPFGVGTSPPALPTPLAGSELRGRRALLVDDNATNRLILTEMLEGFGLRVAVAEDGRHALEFLAAADGEGEPYSIVLSDVQMPGINGFQLAARIDEAEHTQGLPVILLDSSGRAADEASQEASSIAARLSKPVKQSELRDAILRALTPVAGLDERANDPAGLSDASGDQPRRRDLKILLAEDSLPNQKLALALLRREGHEVVVAENGREAVDVSAAQRFDLVLMDVQMPEMDGFAATAAIRLREQQGAARLPIVAMTAHALAGYRERCLEAGMDEYLAKPIRAHQLLGVIDKVVGAQLPTDAAPVAVQAELTDNGDLPWDELLAQVGGDRETLQEIASAYAAEIRATIDGIAAAVSSRDAGDLDSVGRHIHKLKNALRFFQRRQMVSVAEEVESLAEAPNRRDCRTEFGRLRLDALALADAIDLYCSEGSREAEPV